MVRVTKYGTLSPLRHATYDEFSGRNLPRQFWMKFLCKTAHWVVSKGDREQSCSMWTQVPRADECFVLKTDLRADEQRRAGWQKVKLFLSASCGDWDDISVRAASH
eukprot:6189195-Pleurochrysis_carterae.AAC.2